MPIPTVQDLENALLDINDLASFVNGSVAADITTRLGTVLPNLKKVTGQVDDVNALIDTLEVSVNANTADISSLGVATTTAQTTANSALSLAQTTETELDALDVEVTSLSGTVTTLQTDVSTAQTTANSAVTSASNAQSTANSALSTANSNASSITTLQSDVSTAQSTASSAVTLANTAQSTANAAQSTASANASSITTVQSDVSGLQSTVTTQATAITSLENDVATQQAGYAIVATAGDSSAAIEITANAGAGSEVVIRSDRLQIIRDGAAESIFDNDGLITPGFTKTQFFYREAGFSLPLGSVGAEEVISEFELTIGPGVYIFEYDCFFSADGTSPAGQGSSRLSLRIKNATSETFDGQSYSFSPMNFAQTVGYGTSSFIQVSRFDASSVLQMQRTSRVFLKCTQDLTMESYFRCTEATAGANYIDIAELLSLRVEKMS